MENKNNNGLSRKKILSAICLIVFVLLFIFACMKNNLSFGAKIVGTFGVATYAILFLLSFICLAKFLGYSYKNSMFATTFMFLFIISLLLVIHAILSFSILDGVSTKSTFVSYLKYPFENTTVFGVFGCLLCGGISYIIGAMGAIVIFVILATISISLFIYFEVEGKFKVVEKSKTPSKTLVPKDKNKVNTKNISEPQLQTNTQTQKYKDEDVLVEITADFGETNYDESDVVAEITENPNNIETNNVANSNIVNKNNMWQNPFGADGADKQQANKFSNSGYQTDTFPNIYSDEDRKNFLKSTIPNNYKSTELEQNNQSLYSQNFGSYGQQTDNYSSTNGYNSSISNSSLIFDSSNNFYSKNETKNSSFNSDKNDDGRLSQQEFEANIKYDDYSFIRNVKVYNEPNETEIQTYSEPETEIQTYEDDDFSPKAVEDKLSEIVGDQTVLEDIIQEDKNNNFDDNIPVINFNEINDNINNDTNTQVNDNNASENFDKNDSFEISQNNANNIVISSKNTEKMTNLNKKMCINYKYNPPPLRLFNAPVEESNDYAEEQTRVANGIINCFEELGKIDKDYKGFSIRNIVRGPKFTRYEISVPLTFNVSKIQSRINNLQRALSVDKVNFLPIVPNSSNVGFEIKNEVESLVTQRELLENDVYKTDTRPLVIPIGKDISGKVIVDNIPNMVHTLIAGYTGSGKSVFIHSIILSLIYRYSPDDFRFILIDPKKVEFSFYNQIPHLLTGEVFIEKDKILKSIKWCEKEMDRRMSLLSSTGFNNIKSYNSSSIVKSGQYEKLQYIVVIIDEFPDLYLNHKKEIGDSIQRLTQLARAAGIHLILVAQRPSADVVSGVIKNNISTRISFSLPSQIDSRVILDEPGAENLLGKGDMLFKGNGQSVTKHLQAAFCSDDEIRNVVNYVREHNDSYFDENIEEEINNIKDNSIVNSENNVSDGATKYADLPQPKDLDEYFKTAVRIIMQNGSASASFLQRKFQIGYARAARIMDQLENKGFIKMQPGFKGKQVTITPEQYKEEFGEDYDSNDSETT